MPSAALASRDSKTSLVAPMRGLEVRRQRVTFAAPAPSERPSLRPSAGDEKARQKACAQQTRADNNNNIKMVLNTKVVMGGKALVVQKIRFVKQTSGNEEEEEEEEEEEGRRKKEEGRRKVVGWR